MFFSQRFMAAVFTASPAVITFSNFHRASLLCPSAAESMRRISPPLPPARRRSRLGTKRPFQCRCFGGCFALIAQKRPKAKTAAATIAVIVQTLTMSPDQCRCFNLATAKLIAPTATTAQMIAVSAQTLMMPPDQCSCLCFGGRRRALTIAITAPIAPTTATNVQTFIISPTRM